MCWPMGLGTRPQRGWQIGPQCLRAGVGLWLGSRGPGGPRAHAGLLIGGLGPATAGCRAAVVLRLVFTHQCLYPRAWSM